MNEFDNSDTRAVVAVVHCYENHAQDSRVKDCGEMCPQLNAKAGTGGGNLPLVLYRRTRMMESCEECMHYDAMNGGCVLKFADDEQLCPMATGDE